MKTILFSLFSMLSLGIWAQQKYTLNGVITDASNGEKLLGASIFVKQGSQGTTTNEYGFFSLTLPQGTYTLSVEYMGYEGQEITLDFQKNFRKDFALEPMTILIDAVEVSASPFQKAEIRKPEMSVAALPVSTIKKLPVLVGEVDIVKTMLQLPGVSNAGETSSGFNVRGGAADQNLILLDEATIFNASHLFGFLSVYNADAVRDLKLYKGGIPARYGGRIASVLDVYQKDGNLHQLAGTGGVGVLSSRLLVEAPIVKGKGAFLVGGRTSYAHLFLKLANNPNSAYFYDFNVKGSYQLNKNNTLYASGYFGRDFFNLNKLLRNVYGNSFFNVRWNHIYNDKIFSNLSAIYSDYYYGFHLDIVDFQWDSGIKNFNLKYDFKHYYSEKMKFSYGLQGLYYIFQPGELRPTSAESLVQPRVLPNKYALETGFYADVEHTLSKNLQVSYGLRLSSFFNLGKQIENIYADNQPVLFNEAIQTYEKATPIGKKSFGNGKIINLYSHLEPRFTLSYAFNDATSLKGSYTRTAQYLHLLSNTASPTPLDVWTPSNSFIKPQKAHQYALGFARNFKEDAFSLELETYFKHGENRLDYTDGADLIANETIEQVVLQGDTRAYGLEILFRKNVGKFTGWLAYTLSKSEQQTKGRTPFETGINHGAWYSTPHDKLHDLSLTATYSLSKKWTFGGVFTLQTGLPANYPKSKYDYFGMIVANYGKRNEYRLPAYHRLDISATYTPTRKENARWKTEWVFGAYNLYNRKNANSIFFRQNKDTQRNEAVKLSIFGIVPSVTYNFSF